MTAMRRVTTFIDDFNKPITFTAGTPAYNGWTITDTSSAGTPTYAFQSERGGNLKITLAATNEAETVTLSHNDVKSFDIRDLQHVWWILKVDAIDALSVLVAGIGSDQADDEDTMTTNAWFKMEGADSTTAVVLETDDGSTDNDDVASTDTLAGVYKKLQIDFTNGLSDVKFMMDGSRVGEATDFSMSALSAAGAQVQPFLQISKPSGTGVPAVHVAEFGMKYRSSYGQ